MAKNRSFRGKPNKKKKVPSQSNMVAQIQQMQEQMRVQQEQLALQEFTATAGGGALSVTVTGHQRISSITIDPDMLDPEDAEMIQELLVNTLNDALEQSQEKAASSMEGLTGGLDMGSLLGGLGG